MVKKNLYFTEEQLEKLTRKDLCKVASYYGLEVNKKTTKKNLLVMLKDYFKDELAEDTVEEQEVPVSVRVRRIKEGA